MDRLATLFSQAAHQFPKNSALVIDNHTYTYEELNTIILRLAKALTNQGISQGARVAFLLPNSLELIVLYYACFLLGAIAVPVNTQFNKELIGHVLSQSDPTLFITTAAWYQNLSQESVIKNLTCVLTSEAIHYPGVINFQELLFDTDSTNIPTIDLKPHHPALIFFTSGTTGLPKAVVHSHHSLLQGTLNQITQIKMNQEDKTLIMFPLCYLIGLGSQVLPFHAVGATLVVLPQFNPKEALEQIHSHSITKLYGFPKLYLELIHTAEKKNTPINTLNFCFSGGDAIAVSLQERFKSLFHCKITEGCGMSELQIYSLNSFSGTQKTGSIGIPISGVTLKLIDAKDRVISESNKTGELLVNTQSMCLGYWQDAALTEKTIKNGWFHTQDLAYRDEDGCYWFVSRKVDVIQHGDKLISPMALERIFYQNPAVKEAAAIALPNSNEQPLDSIIVYVVLQDKNISTKALMDYVSERLPVDYCPQAIVVLEQLPYGFTGKIDRRALRKRALSLTK